MPLIKPRTNRVPYVRHICRLKEPNRDALVSYARFIGDTPDYVLNQLLEVTLMRDRDFATWRADHASNTTLASSLPTTSSPTVQPPASEDVPDPSPDKTVRR